MTIWIFKKPNVNTESVYQEWLKGQLSSTDFSLSSAEKQVLEMPKAYFSWENGIQESLFQCFGDKSIAQNEPEDYPSSFLPEHMMQNAPPDISYSPSKAFEVGFLKPKFMRSPAWSSLTIWYRKSIFSVQLEVHIFPRSFYNEKPPIISKSLKEDNFIKLRPIKNLESPKFPTS